VRFQWLFSDFGVLLVYNAVQVQDFCIKKLIQLELFRFFLFRLRFWREEDLFAFRTLRVKWVVEGIEAPLVRTLFWWSTVNIRSTDVLKVVRSLHHLFEIQLLRLYMYLLIPIHFIRRVRKANKSSSLQNLSRKRKKRNNSNWISFLMQKSCTWTAL
jgi:hypothetical protein